MSHSESSTMASIDDAITLPAGVAAAFNRSRGVFLGSDAFVDRVFSLHSIVDEIHAWRWAGAISGEQCGFLLRKIRRDIEAQGLGEIHQGPSAEEVLAREEEHAKWEAEYEEERRLKIGITA